MLLTCRKLSQVYENRLGDMIHLVHFNAKLQCIFIYLFKPSENLVACICEWIGNLNIQGWLRSAQTHAFGGDGEMLIDNNFPDALIWIKNTWQSTVTLQIISALFLMSTSRHMFKVYQISNKAILCELSRTLLLTNSLFYRWLYLLPSSWINIFCGCQT